MSAEEIRQAILRAELPREPTEVPWTDEKVYVQSLTFDDYKRWMRGAELKGEELVRLVARCLVTEDGTRILRDEDAKILGQKHPKPILDLATQIMRLSAVTIEGREDVVEDFGGARSNGATTG